jgi:hypothetical protein
MPEIISSNLKCFTYLLYYLSYDPHALKWRDILKLCCKKPFFIFLLIMWILLWYYGMKITARVYLGEGKRTVYFEFKLGAFSYYCAKSWLTVWPMWSYYRFLQRRLWYQTDFSLLFLRISIILTLKNIFSPFLKTTWYLYLGTLILWMLNEIILRKEIIFQ